MRGLRRDTRLAGRLGRRNARVSKAIHFEPSETRKRKETIRFGRVWYHRREITGREKRGHEEARHVFQKRVRNDRETRQGE